MKCKIKNEKAIRFRYFKNSNRVIAFCDEPVIIENKALGYLIKFQLEDFEVDFRQHTSVFAGYTLFEEMEGGEVRKRRWLQARDKAFYGSTMHFMRSVYHHTVAAEGYEIFRMKKIPNREKERVKKIFQAAHRVRRPDVNAQDSAGMGIDSTRLFRDSADHYRSILRQNDISNIYGQDRLTADSLVIEAEGNYKLIFFADYLYITYKNELEEKAYVFFNNEDRRPTFQRSSSARLQSCKTH